MESMLAQTVESAYGDPLLIMTSAMVDTGNSSPSPQIVERSQLKAQLKRQVEYYFSRENLNHDTYLVSQMDSDQYVDISTIASFNQVKKLTLDQDLLVEVLKESKCVQVDDSERKVRPLHKRSVVILREIPEGTTQQEIETILTHPMCPVFVSCEYAAGNCWYVDFETETKAQEAFRYIREILQTFKGQRIMARIKAKPSAMSVNASRPEQQQPRVEGPAAALAADSMRARVPPPPTTSAIRYPVQLPHFPLQSPQYPFPVTQAAGAFPYMPPYQFIQHPLLPQSWSVFPPDQNFAYDVNGYGYHTVPNQSISSQPRPVSQNNRNGQERKNHSRGGGNSSDRSEPPHSAVNGPGSNTTSTKTGAGAHSGYHSVNGHDGGEVGGYHKHGGPGGRGRGYGGGGGGGGLTQQDHYNNVDNIPPRHRDGAYGYRLHKRVSASSRTPHTATPPISRHVRQTAAAGEAHNGGHAAGHLPHHSSNRTPASFAHSHESRAGKDHSNRQSGNGSSDSHPHNNRQHGAHRNSKSPEKDIEQQQQATADVNKSKQSFELDANAFPALPGAMSPTATTISQSHSMDGATATTTVTSSAHTQVSVSATDHSIKPTNANDSSNTEHMNGNIDSVSELSDIAESSVPDVPKLSDIVKRASKPPSVAPSTSHHKDCAEKPAPSTSTSSLKSPSGKPHSASAAQHKSRPAHLTNGTHNADSTPNKNSAHKAAGGGPSASSASAPLSTKHAEVAASKPVAKGEPVSAQASKKVLSPGLASGANEQAVKPTAGSQTSPTDHKLSYAAMAQRVAAITLSQSASTKDQHPATAAIECSGDNNNNGDNNKPTTGTHTSKTDNLYSSTAAKNSSNSATTSAASMPRKVAAGNGPHARNGPIKPKPGGTSSNIKPSPTSPSARTPPARTPSSHSSSSPAVVAR